MSSTTDPDFYQHWALRKARERLARFAEPHRGNSLSRVCPKGPITAGHHVRSDNPMATGRCENCRAFVAFTRDGWRACTTQQAARWGRYGQRLVDVRTDYYIAPTNRKRTH